MSYVRPPDYYRPPSMSDEMQILVTILILSSLIKTIFNWIVWNKNDKNNKIKFKPGAGFSFAIYRNKERKEIDAANWLLIYSCLFIHFWINIPKDKTGKILAWSVLGITIIQIVTLLFMFQLDK